ncbi:MAG: shikimate dehydrogenase [Rhodospirillaceae bacterium]|nr:shikimate dehydrogenase [Rhodospirillaceae bacterium]MBT5240869.1 shikimate dehydrogenase [Rhodospirillaceae bacterium]MBT5565030.1 shikimate dehydrogenase [Rhodospirillaceae bacterium]MBT6090206.1 shikimate dehydrogenase [Rhodospirillaceae bacterium]MBT6961720.1 shikimate dehydrogenase [Rhodospirillaceae bacterium]
MSLSGHAKLAGVMGWPISHSLSPRLHGYWLREHEIDGAYVPLPVAPNNLEHALRALPSLGFSGVNLTVPHKESALPIMDTVTDIARRIGAVNTVFVTDDGKLTGTNTDASGFMENLRLNALAWLPTDGAAVVLGAGGAARAVVAALIDANVPEIRLLNRTFEKAVSLAESLEGPTKVIDWADRDEALSDAVLLVNTTILGMVNQPPLEISLKLLSKTAIVNDLVYAPLETELLFEARRLGRQTVDGLGMLLHQAVPGFEGWFGVRPDVSAELRQSVLTSA